MGMVAPHDGGYVGGLTKLRFDAPVGNLELTLNGAPLHAEEGDAGPSSTFTVDLNGPSPDTRLHLGVSYDRADGSRGSESIVVCKPRDDLGGMGATVVRVGGVIDGVFFKLWLPRVRSVFIRGSFNDWKDVNRLDPLGDSGYWFGYSCDARPGDDYRFFVYTLDGKLSEVSDPAARQTKKTAYNAADAQDANAVIVDPEAFAWAHDGDFLEERRDLRRMIIYQAHWGTFLRSGAGAFETFVTQTAGESAEARRASVRTKLEYVRALGFTALQLLPIHEANGQQNAGYDPSFFFAVESAYGTPDDLRMLVDEAHGLGLAVVFDAVINHLTADRSHSSFSQEFLRGWYARDDAPWSNQAQFGGTSWGPTPDWDRREIRNLLTDSMLMYLREFHVDGIRFDATTTIPRDALRELIARLRADPRSAGVYLIAEHLTGDPLSYVVGDIGFHAGWYKPAFEAGMSGCLQPLGRGDLDALRKVVETDHGGEPASAVKYVTGSHDECWTSHGGRSAVGRLGGAANEYARMKVRLACALGACSLGTPMMFMGTELLTDQGWNESASYGAASWQVGADSESGKLQRMIRELNQLRQQHGALRGGNVDARLVHRDDDNGVLAYKRWDLAGGVFLVVVNLSDHNWGGREYQVGTDTPGSAWHECFNSQYVLNGGWTGACNSDPLFYPRADDAGLLQGINVARWCLLILEKQG